MDLVDITGYEGIYKITTDGRVYSVRNDIFLKQKLTSGYLAVDLKLNGKRKNFYVHRLVAEAFIPNTENLRTVNHKDGNKLNNNVDNLEWMNHSDNLKHAYSVGLKEAPSTAFLKGEERDNSVLTDDIARDIIEKKFKGFTPKQIQRKFYPKYNISTIRNVYYELTFKHIWEEYKNERHGN